MSDSHKILELMSIFYTQLVLDTTSEQYEEVARSVHHREIISELSAIQQNEFMKIVPEKLKDIVFYKPESNLSLDDYFSSLSTDEVTLLLNCPDKFGYTILHMAAVWLDATDFEAFLASCVKSNQNIISLLSHRVISKEPVWQSALENDDALNKLKIISRYYGKEKIIKMLCEGMLCRGDCSEDKIEDYVGVTYQHATPVLIMDYLVPRQDEVFLAAYDYLPEDKKREVITRNRSDHSNLCHKTAGSSGKFKRVVSSIPKRDVTALLLSYDDHGHNVYHRAAGNVENLRFLKALNPEIFKFENLLEMTDKPSGSECGFQKNTLFHMASSNYEALSFLLLDLARSQITQLINTRNTNGDNSFNCYFDSHNINDCKKLLTMIGQEFGGDIMKKIIRSKNQDGESLYDWSVNYCDLYAMITKLEMRFMTDMQHEHRFFSPFKPHENIIERKEEESLSLTNR
jgi:hypothetical protein